jgi:hypothetical protein
LDVGIAWDLWLAGLVENFWLWVASLGFSKVARVDFPRFPIASLDFYPGSARAAFIRIIYSVYLNFRNSSFVSKIKVG